MTTANTNAQALKIVNDMITNLTITGGKIANSTITSDKLAFSIPSQVSPIPTGGIIMWSGSIANIPGGWTLCNGSNGAPDLRDRFVVGDGSTYDVGNVGGANTVALTVGQMPDHDHAVTVTDPGHKHGVAGYAGIGNQNRINSGVICCGSGPETTSSTTGITVEVDNRGGGQAHENRPPYYALAYIMKL